MDTAKISITKLNGSNYLIWATQVEALLQARGLWKYIEGDETQTPVDPTRLVDTNTEVVAKEKNSVRATIICTIEPEYISVVAGEGDPKVMWTKLADANKSKCTASLHTLRNKLLNMSMHSGETIREYVNRLCTIERQLAFAGKIVDDSDKKYALLNGLRPEFEVKKTILMESYETSFEKMVSSLDQTEDQCRSKSSRSKTTGSSGGTTFVTSGTGNKKATCWICERSGHRMSDCFFNPKSNKYKSSMQRTPKIIENLKKRKLIEEGSNKSKTKGHECEFTFMVHHVDDIKERWFLDSCSSRHLCNERKHFIDYRKLDESEYVNAACEGGNVRVVGIGNVRVSQFINDEKKTTLLKDVGYAPKCRTNLVSMPKAQLAGITVMMEAYSTKMTGKFEGRTVFVGDSESTGICELTSMKPVSDGNISVSFFNAGEDDEMQLAHRRTCHTAISTLEKMEATKAVDGLGELKSTKKIGSVCEACVEGKSMNQRASSTSRKIFEEGTRIDAY